MVNCFVPQCHHRSDSIDRQPCTGFTSFPKDKRLFQKWIKLIRREDRKPGQYYSRICSCHFPGGNMKALPSIFPWNQKPEKRNKTLNLEKKPESNSDLEAVWNRVETKNQAVPNSLSVIVHDIEREDTMNVEVLDLASNTEETETDRLKEEVELLREKVSQLRACEMELKQVKDEVKELNAENQRLLQRSLVFSTVVQDDELCYHYTGLNGKVVTLLHDLILRVSEKFTINSVKVLSCSDQLLLTLVRLRRNLSYRDLAFRFGVSVSTVQLVFSTILQVLHEVLFCHFMDTIPSRQKNQMFIPECFKSYPNTRIVLDCTEISCEIPKNMEKQKATYSNYKGRNTLKYLTGCSSNGCITYCSAAFPGSTSDKAIVQHTGLMSEMAAGDVILADKGFIISDSLPVGVSLNIPPFLRDPEFSEDQVFECRTKSRARIHIERLNARLKRFLICTHVPHKLFSSIDMIVQTCCALINLQNPILSECSEFFNSLGSNMNSVTGSSSTSAN